MQLAHFANANRRNTVSNGHVDSLRATACRFSMAKPVGQLIQAAAVTLGMIVASAAGGRPETCGLGMFAPVPQRAGQALNLSNAPIERINDALRSGFMYPVAMQIHQRPRRSRFVAQYGF